MGKVNLTHARVVAILQADNPRARKQDVVIYANAFMTYVEAAANIEKRWNVVAHPRTGAPIENPYCKILALAARALKGAKRLKTDALWDAGL